MDTTYSGLLKTCNEYRHHLAEIYDNRQIERGEITQECQGGWNFSMPIKTLIKQEVLSPPIIESLYSALKCIEKWKSSGYVSWETRRFIRHARVKQFIDQRLLLLEYANTLYEYGKRQDDVESELMAFDMDGIYWDRNWSDDGNKCPISVVSKMNLLREKAGLIEINGNTPDIAEKEVVYEPKLCDYYIENDQMKLITPEELFEAEKQIWKNGHK